MANQFQSTTRSWRSATSAAAAVTGSYNLSSADVFDASSSSCDESPASISGIAITFQDMHVNSSSSNSSAQEVQALDFGLLSPSNSIQWNQPFFGRGDDSSFHALLQEDMTRSSFLFHDDSSSTMINNNNTIPLIVSSSCDGPMLQKNDSRLMTPFIHHPHSYPVNYQQVQDLNQSQLLQQQVPRSNFHPSDQPIANSMGNSGVASSSNLEKKTSSKKPRLAGTSSSLATFKVRKEKLGDRITALQQLVSPFGKTDTASVLHEAIEYIKFLHNQVRVSSSPYLKNVHKIQRSMNESEVGEGEDDDLKSKGLCLVPISSTKFAVVNHEIPSDFWGTPNFVGEFR
ncbi:uncharacterized protein LOC141842078 [Curcuma longa]|uniref:uncharacterized protein LOC141842078 n=1 Tax=Curcuma longa TaxID=136217 RepID=UPI003D9DE1C9